MAEASVDHQQAQDPPQFFCHKCKSEIRPVMPDMICPTCNGGFIEQLSDDSTDHSDETSFSGNDRWPFQDDDDDASFILGDLNLASHMTGSRGPRRSNSGSSSTSPTGFGGLGGLGGISGGGGLASLSRNPGAADSNRTGPGLSFPPPRRTVTINHRGGGGVGGGPPQEMIQFLQQFLSFANPPPMAPGGFSFPVQMLNIHGSPRDYAWGEGGLDAIITQLLNNAEGHGPPPAPDLTISGLEIITINNVHIEQSSDCAVCKEDFEGGETAKKLPCKHFFHPDCVDTWLRMHNSCPVCRDPVEKPVENQSSSSNPR